MTVAALVLASVATLLSVVAVWRGAERRRSFHLKVDWETEDRAGREPHD